MAAIPASASVAFAGAPPANLALAYGASGGLHLSWSPPVDALPEAYKVYHNGLLVATVAATFFDDPVVTSLGMYAVTAVSGSAEGAPAMLYFFAPSYLNTQGQHVENMLDFSGLFPLPVIYPWECGLIGVQVIPPGYAINEGCIPLPSPARAVSSA
ncbi:MAG TPA: hypothetical protein VM241_04140 [Candidatus Thermoplasmatota archaeon]|nr:hypothetical protein [Candidatus Thermoplasmatota archaeon]